MGRQEYDCTNFSRRGSIEPSESFQYKMRNGLDFRIDKFTLLKRGTLCRQLNESKCVQVKFCVRDDEAFSGNDSNDNIEHWEIVFFPMYDKDGDEITHGTIVDYDDSCVNGNLCIGQKKVVSVSSNHYGSGYLMLQDPILEYASKQFQEILDKI